jgi:hypothetical protein
MGSSCSTDSSVWPGGPRRDIDERPAPPQQLQGDSVVPRRSRKWKIKLSKAEARDAFIATGTLPQDAGDDLLVLRVFLEESHTLMKLAEFAKRKGKLHYLLCWIDFLGFRIIPEERAFQLSTANSMRLKYFTRDSALCVGECLDGIPQLLQDTAWENLALAEQGSRPLPVDVLDVFGHECLRQINELLYKPFKSSILYVMSLVVLRAQFNHVGIDDFEYMELLGQGSFGLVVHCRKKSTGKHYAMKIQSKISLLNCFSDNLKRVTGERDVLVKLHHPFIISLDYAFQTPDCAILVTALGTGTFAASARVWTYGIGSYGCCV